MRGPCSLDLHRDLSCGQGQGFLQHGAGKTIETLASAGLRHVALPHHAARVMRDLHGQLLNASIGWHTLWLLPGGML